MLSRLYEGQVTHHRREPDHGFSYPVWYAYLHLDEIDRLSDQSRWLSLERFNLLSFYSRDYLPDADVLAQPSLKRRVQALILRETGGEFQGDIYLLTTFRQLGYAMNPISLFYCFVAGSSKPRYVIAEVHNTPWGERHTYFLEPRADGSAVQSKAFHVSPFMPMDLDYRFTLPSPGDETSVGIKLTKQGAPIFHASLNLQTSPMTATTLHRLLINHGWQSVKTMSRIYFQALRLWMKKATFFTHPNRKQTQTQHLRKSTP